MTECIQSRLAFAGEGKRDVVAEFNVGTISSDRGALLLRATDRKIKLLEEVQPMLSGWPQSGFDRARSFFNFQGVRQAGFSLFKAS